jgi:cell division protein FtsI/penicillin-binding protein 2
MDTDGAILAAVGFPDVPPVGKITAWDLAAFARVYPDSNPLQVRAWEGIDRHLAAGSTFKTVTALAGIAASLESPNINAMLYGLSSKNFTALTGVRLKDFQINPLRGSGSNSSRTIRNFQSEPTSYLLNKEFRAKACPDQGTDKYDLSLTSALRDSMNTWFVALSMLLDGEPKTGDKPKNTDLQFVKTMQELGLGTKQPLFLNSPSNLYETMPKAAAEQIDLLSNAPGNLRWIMAQASIGQGTLVTPLRMATIAASIAIGKQVIPHLDLVWKTANEMQPIKVATSNTNIFNSDLTLLRTGMRAVIQNGTAHTAFLKTPPSIRCHTYAKTGTAQIGRRDNTGQLEEFGSAWIIGWHQPSGIQLPLAFACLITHVKNTGGEICAPIIAEILQTISKN